MAAVLARRAHTRPGADPAAFAERVARRALFLPLILTFAAVSPLIPAERPTLSVDCCNDDDEPKIPGYAHARGELCHDATREVREVHAT